LLGGHRRSRDLLVEQMRHAPHRRPCFVERVDRVGQEREQQPERAREHEGAEEVRGLGACVLTTVDDRPPERRAGDEVRRVLDVQDGVRMPEREVVRGRHVPGEVRAEPDDERGDHRDANAPRKLRRQRKHEQRGRPFRDRDVLEEVRSQQVVERERLERCREDGGEKEHGEDEAGDAPARDRVSADDQVVRERQRRHERECVGLGGPSVRIHSGYAISARP